MDFRENLRFATQRKRADVFRVAKVIVLSCLPQKMQILYHRSKENAAVGIPCMNAGEDVNMVMLLCYRNHPHHVGLGLIHLSCKIPPMVQVESWLVRFVLPLVGTHTNRKYRKLILP